jgi:hypothetical protein
MRANGAVHIGNDTFLAATKDVTDSLFLFSSCFPTEEQLAALPLARQVRFNPHAALPCSPAELEQYTATAVALELGRKPTTDTASQRSGTAKESAMTVAVSRSKELTSPLFRHSLHASSNGQQIAVISNVLRHHYIIDIATEPAAVCALETPEVVRSVCWHPVTPCVLYVLFVSGDLMVYDTSRSQIGVVLPRHRRIALRPVVQRCLAEAEQATGGEVRNHDTPSTSSATSPAPPTVVSTTFANAIAQSAVKCRTSTSNGQKHQKTKEDSHHPVQKPPSATTSSRPFVSPSVYTASCERNLLPVYEVHTTSSPTTGTVLTASHLAASFSQAVAEQKAFDEVIPIDKEPDDELVGGVKEISGATTPLHRRTSEADLVDLYALPPTCSIPVILLVLSSSGDVYAVHLNEEDTLPELATASVMDDGRLRTIEREQQRLAEQRTAAAASTVNAEVHHLIAGTPTSTWDEALAVRGCLVDADAGTHAVFFYTANGMVKGAWVSEPDLLARHRTAHVRTTGGPNIAFTVQLGSRGGVVRECLSPAVPSTTHTVTMVMSGNVCLLRRGETGEESFLLAMPCWDCQRRGWSCWKPAVDDSAATARMRHALPLLSTGDAVPPPVSLRLPYDTRGASVALGVQEMLLVPELASLTTGKCARHRIFSISLLSLLRSVLYARCGTMQLHPVEGRLRPPAADVKRLVAATAQSDTAAAAAAAAAGREGLLKMVNLIPTCHRQWLCGAEQTEVDATTVELATLVERRTRDVEQRERLQGQRRERLMARVAALEGRVAEMNSTYDKWQQTLLDAIVHRRGVAALQTANERLGEVHRMLNEWEHLP